jgi:predicted TIM-barrel fold metal-dependent hydrolase
VPNHTTPSRISRRAFSASGLAAGMLAAAQPLATGPVAAWAKPHSPQTAEQTPQLVTDGGGWIDAHVHVWTPDTKKYPLSKNYTVADMQPASFTPEELFEHCRPAGVDRVVLIQMSFYEGDHAYLRAAMQAHPGVFAGVAVIDYRQVDVIEQMQQLIKEGMRGFRLHARGGAKEWEASERMQAIWRLAAERGVAVCPLIDPDEIVFVDRLCSRFPETTVVVDHFARVGISGEVVPEQLGALCDLARHGKTYVKTSAFYALGKKQPPYDDLAPMIRRVVEAYGVERLMWASDCPYQVQEPHSYDASIALVRDRLDFLSQRDKEWLLRDTAHKVFFA